MKRSRMILLSGLVLVAAAGVAYAQTYYKILVQWAGPDVRYFTADGDWYNGAQKVECGNDQPALVGVSITPHQICGYDYLILRWCSLEHVQNVLCSDVPGAVVDQNMGATLVFGGQNDRRDSTWGDWASGLYKGECAANEVMTGLALNPNPQQFGYGVMGARCSRSSNMTGATACVTQDFRDSDAQETPPILDGDWDPGYFKGQCGQGRYIKGIAHNGHGGRPLAILCCSPLF